jgi:AraC-like DNA-binding protein
MLIKSDKSTVVPGLAKPAPPATFFQSRTIDGAVSWLSGLNAPFKLKVGNLGTADLTANILLSGDMCFATGSSRSGFELVFEDPFDGYGMSIPVSGSLLLNTLGRKTMAPEPGNGVIVDLGTISAIVYSPQSEFRTIAIKSSELHRQIAFITEQPVRERVVFPSFFQKDSGAPKFIFAIGQALMNGLQGDAPLREAPAAVASLKDAILSMLVEGISHNYSALLSRRTASAAPRNVKRAIEFMHAHVTDALLLEEIAVAAQSSPRSLQMAFRQFRGITPMAYLRRIRLDGARNEMLNGSAQIHVSDVAYRWGFAHHGIFTARYKLAFGEAPSKTLKRSRNV